MEIKSISYHNKAESWKLNKLELDELNLLVGVSGVGKSKILEAIENIKSIANGESANGVKWKVTFIDEKGNTCVWEGEYDNLGLDKELRDIFKGPPEYDISRDEPVILSEKLFVNGKQIVKRTKTKIQYKDTVALKLSPEESIVSLLKESEFIPIFEGFKKIRNYSDLYRGRSGNYELAKLTYTNIDDIQFDKLTLNTILALIYEFEREMFDEIVDNFIKIFPHVSEGKVGCIEDVDLPAFATQIPWFQIKENKVERWLYYWELSNGMRKALIIISALYLLPRKSVLLIDEFENSLGINCIDAVAEQLSKSREIQLIITSHHPYIINTIDMDFWKIITRVGGIVKSRKASDFPRLSKLSLHDNYTRLLEISEIIEDGIDNL